MWKDSDFKELFEQYNPSPPVKVWENVAYTLKETCRPVTPIPFFTNIQKMALLVASISSIVLCGFTLGFSEEPSVSSHHYMELRPISHGNKISSIPSIVRQTNTLNHSIPTSSRNVSKSNIVSKVKLNIPVEYKGYEKEILAIAELDQQIDKLGKEIAQLKQEESIESKFDNPNLSASASSSVQKANQNWKRYQELNLNENKVQLNEENLSISTSSKLSFLDKLYITPYMGTNYTNVFYQDKPANNYFSDKAKFSGQLGYNAGVQFGYQLSKRWSLESGIGLGQYILGFKEDYGTHIRDGKMYIDQLDIPMMARYSIPFGSKNLPLSVSLKGGLIYSNVIFYQVNYTDKFTRITPIGQNEEYHSVDVDKRQYNSAQFGYAGGFDFDAFFSKKIALNLSMLNALVSQANNFPFFSQEKQRPVQFSTSFSIGTKIKF
jgi:hypothetical protein